MWVTKRKTLQAKKHHKKYLLKLSFLSGIFVVSLYLGIMVYRMLFTPPPLLSPVQQVAGSAIVSQNDTFLNQLKNELSQKGIEVRGVQKMKDGNYQVLFNDNGEVIIAANHTISSQIASLQLILTRLTMEGKHFTMLDMRFDKPVIITNYHE